MNKIKDFFKTIELVYWVIASSFVLLILLGSYLNWAGNKKLALLDEKINIITSSIKLLEENSISTTAELKKSITQTHIDLSSALDNEKRNVGEIEDLLGVYKKENEEISGTITTLEKLSKTDPELLQKYSKVFFLNEHYAPARLAEIIDTYEYYESKFSKIDAQVWPYLENMLKASLSDNLEIYVYSAYRSYEEQNALKSLYTITYGEGTANQFSADQGYSEHQLGTTIDLITTGIGGTLEGFEETEAYLWLLNNAHKFGFTLSYPEYNDFYVFEPWHWRFVGIKLATYLHDNQIGFYDLDQREIDEYLVNLFE
ncbi:MAG: M15 family metallopeptidase [Candidatus Pacebacteria bacterium]|nr:M15 family metallopeptidase [Candidatus Paceibacterota bacterium]